MLQLLGVLCYRRMTDTDMPGGGHRGRLYALAALLRARLGHLNSELPFLAGHESQRIIVSDAKGLRRRAELLLALANKARDDNYTQLADYILARADQLFEEARIRELEPSSLSAPVDDPMLIDKVAI